MEKGKYHGFYQFDNRNIEKLSGFDKTNFTIEVTDLVGKKFSGWIEDDITSGGMEGRGTIFGGINRDKIWFVKEMPYWAQHVKDNETGYYQVKMDKTKKHRTLYYTGLETEVNQYSGKWIFIYGFLEYWKHLILLMKGIRTGGRWEMSKIKE